MKRFLLLTTTLAALLALSAPVAQAGKTLNGPALDGRQVALPAGLRIGAPAAEEAQRIATNGPALDGRRVALPDLSGLAIDPLLLPGSNRGILPVDRRWPVSEQDRQLRQ